MSASTVQDQARMAELRERGTYLGDRLRECDVVMKGGITSGVLYPLAVCELATHVPDAQRRRHLGRRHRGRRGRGR